VREERVFYGVAKDITERKEAEIALRESEAGYRLLAESATDMISSHALDGTFRYVSSACRTLLGYEPEELIGTNGFDLYHPEELERVRAKYQRLLAGGERERDTVRFRRKDGSWLWVEVVARIGEDDRGEPLLQAATRDMTDARHALEALQSAEERFRTAFDEAPIGMAIFDLERRILRVNAALCELFGRSEEELLGRTADDFTYPQDLPLTTGRIGELRDGDVRSVTIEKRYVRKDGQIIWAQASASTMHDADGNPVGLLGQVEDISVRRAAEEETRVARVAAERANRAKSEFLSRMSHEVRTPLNAVLGFAQLLELEDLEPGQRESVARIIAGGNHLLALINDVLDISRIEAGQLPISVAPVDLPAAVESVVHQLDPMAAARSITVTADLSAVRGAEVLADRRRLEQVLLNLLSNAIKYGPEGSAVGIRGVCGKDTARVNVIDEGPGIRAEDLKRLFVPFERLGADGVEGTGLGLALSRNLVEAMGGEIGVDSAERGSVFWVELPLAGTADSGQAARRFAGERRARRAGSTPRGPAGSGTRSP
jgi:PAS domain S-box-containing protein